MLSNDQFVNLKAIVTNLINGNIADFNEAVQNLSPMELIGIISIWKEAGEDYHVILNKLLAVLLEKREDSSEEEKLKVSEVIKGIKKKSFVSDYKASDSEAMGLLISHYFEWNGNEILEACAFALEDANFHTECELVREMLKKIEDRAMKTLEIKLNQKVEKRDGCYL